MNYQSLTFKMDNFQGYSVEYLTACEARKMKRMKEEINMCDVCYSLK